MISVCSNRIASLNLAVCLYSNPFPRWLKFFVNDQAYEFLSMDIDCISISNNFPVYYRMIIFSSISVKEETVDPRMFVIDSKKSGS